jgi:hypothetical protein
VRRVGPDGLDSNHESLGPLCGLSFLGVLLFLCLFACRDFFLIFFEVNHNVPTRPLPKSIGISSCDSPSFPRLSGEDSPMCVVLDECRDLTEDFCSVDQHNHVIEVQRHLSIHLPCSILVTTSGLSSPYN